MATTMVPDISARPDVFPTDRLLKNGMCGRELRADLRRINNARNALSVAVLWGMVIGLVALAVWINSPISYLFAFICMGPLYVRFAILMHEAAHKLLFSNKRLNDWVGTWLIAYPAFTPISLYRRVHFSHHKEEFGPDEPDMAYYGGYQCDRRTFDPATGARRRWNLGLEELRTAAQVGSFTRLSPSRSVHSLGASTYVGRELGRDGKWWIYPLLWWLPWMTQWRVLNRLRSIAEHGGMEKSQDRRATTHNVRQSLLGSSLAGALQHWLAFGSPCRYGDSVP